MASAHPTHATNTPISPSSTFDEDDVIPSEDSSEVTKLFLERLRAWKHAVSNLEDYTKATEKVHKDQHKEYERVLKTVSTTLKEADHFEGSAGGVTGLFENIRTNTQQIANSNLETSKVLNGTVLSTFERLHTEIKHKQKELSKGAGKGTKAVDKARVSTQKHIELLASTVASYDSTGGKFKAEDDPYILQRGINHRLNKQVLEENNNRADLLEVQNTFAQFEGHVLEVIQTGLRQLQEATVRQSDLTKTHYTNIFQTSAAIPPNFEWTRFVQRKSDVLIDPSSPPRSVANIAFPNQNHRSTQPLIAGSLERKGKLLKSYNTNYYVITPSKFLHEFKTDDDFAKDPSPEASLYLPDCFIGNLDGPKFAVKGKDASGGKLSLSMSHEYQFRAHTPADAVKWYEIIRTASGGVDGSLVAGSDSTPASPAVGAGEFAPVAAAGVAPTSAPVAQHAQAPVQSTQAAPAATHAPVGANYPPAAAAAPAAAQQPIVHDPAIGAAAPGTTTSIPIHSATAPGGGVAPGTATTTTGGVASGVPPHV